MKIGMLVALYVGPPWTESTKNCVLGWSKALTKLGNETHVVNIMPRGALHKERLYGIHFHRVLSGNEIASHFPFPYTLKEAIAYFGSCANILNFTSKILKKDKLEIIHWHSGSPSVMLFSFFLRLRHKVPVLHSIHSRSSFHFFSSPVFYKIGKGLSKVICATRSIEREVKKRVSHEKVVFLPNGVDIKRFRPMNREKVREKLDLPNAPIVTYVGGLGETRGIGTFVRSSPYILQEMPDTRFLICARSFARNVAWRQYNQTRSLLKKLGVEKSFIWLGPQERIEEIYNASDIIVDPPWEIVGIIGHPFVILESMACGIPVISTKIREILEILKNNKTGIVVPPKEERSVANAVIELFQDPKKANELGREARRFIVNNHDIEKLAKRCQEIYESLVQ